MAASPDPVERLKAALADRYSIEREIGAGGMAVVFEAHDLKHNRSVAVKVLRSELAAILGSERFLKEIEVTANLQHPNILPLYDSGEADAFLYYVMPLVEGETLRERLDRDRELSVEEAVSIARSVAAALDYAHRHDIVHRDVKPSNIVLHEGQALVADFGIALAMKNAGTGTRLTETGLSIGTPHYMSPEQATGDRELGAQSDIYSLGAVTYEMLVGEPPHVANSAQAVVAKILSDTPAPIRRTRELVPPNVEAAVAKAIARNPADRFRSAAEFADALSNPAFTLPTMAAAAAAQAPSRWAMIGPAMTGVAALMAGLAAWGWLRPGPAGHVARWELPLGEDEEFLAYSTPNFFDVAPDGGWIVEAGADRGDLRIRHRDRLEPVPLPGTDSAYAPRVSPDGTRIAFLAGRLNALRVVPVGGGSTVTLADSVGAVTWIDDEALLVSDYEGDLFLMPALGGDRERVLSADSAGIGDAFALAPLPDRRGALFTGCREPCDAATPRQVHVLDLRSGETRALFPATSATYTPLGHVVFTRSDGALVAAPFDLKRLELTGPAMPVGEGLAASTFMAGFRLGPDGTALMGLGPVRATTAVGPNREVVRVSRRGEIAPVDADWQVRVSTVFGGMALSPDGTRLAIALLSDDNEDIWVKELPDGPISRLTQAPEVEARPTWTPDGEHVVFSSGLNGQGGGGVLRRRRADGADAVSDLLQGLEVSPVELDISPDGAWAVARVGGGSSVTSVRDIVAIRLGDDPGIVPLLTEEFDEAQPHFSPDGRWLAYNSNESGRYEVYVRPFPDVGSARIQISANGGMNPMWNRAGNEILYFEQIGEAFEYKAMAATYSLEGGLRVTRREELFRFSSRDLSRPQGLANSFILTPDGESLLAQRVPPAAGQVDEAGDAPPIRLVLVENWLEEMRQTLGLKR